MTTVLPIYQPSSPSLQYGIQKINWNVELEGEGEEYREGHHYLHQDCQAVREEIFFVELVNCYGNLQLVHGQIERDAPSYIVSIFQVSWQRNVR